MTKKQMVETLGRRLVFLESLDFKNDWDKKEAAALKKILALYEKFLEGMDEDGNQIGE